MQFDGLNPFEWVLLVLGVILFFVAVIGFFIQLKNKGNLTPILGFFVAAIIMIGYPSIQSFQLAGIEVTMQQATNDLHNDPGNGTARQALQDAVNKLGNRSFADPAVLTNLSSAQFALGDEQAAKDNLNKALQKDPTLGAAQQLKTRIATLDKIEPLLAKVQSNPADAQARADLTQATNEAAQLKIANPLALQRLVQAQKAIGDTTGSAKTNTILQNINRVPAQPKKSSHVKTKGGRRASTSLS